MNLEEIKKKLESGEKPVCPQCEFSFNEGDDCIIICCNDPFKGPGKFEDFIHGE